MIKTDQKKKSKKKHPKHIILGYNKNRMGTAHLFLFFLFLLTEIFFEETFTSSLKIEMFCLNIND